MNIYETDKLLSEYLLFHYASAEEILPENYGGEEALFYPVRCVTECVDVKAFPPGPRALDLGCAVGRSTFELAKLGAAVVGIDNSQRFIETAQTLCREGSLNYTRADEGALTTSLTARVPAGAEPSRVVFEQGDAQELREDLGTFDVVLLANLIDRLRDPRRCLARLPGLVKPGGQLIISSPYTWLEEFTPREHWLGGFDRFGMRVTTLEGLRGALAADFDLVTTKELPFLLREHARKYQLSVAQASIWRRRTH